jgi:hypothetical protein
MRPKGAGATQTLHNGRLFQALTAEIERLNSTTRRGTMFGCPAIFVGRRMAACVYGDLIGLRVPRDIAAATLAAGRGVAFRPYGRPAMAEWISPDISSGGIAGAAKLLKAALDFAAANNAK